MQSIDHKWLYVKCDNVGLLGAIGYIYLGNLDFKMWILCVLEILFIGSVTMTQGNSWINIISSLLLFIELGKILLGIICHLCNRFHCDQGCYRSHDMIWFKSILYFRIRLLLCSLSVSVYYCCTLIFQVAWTLWVILVN